MGRIWDISTFAKGSEEAYIKMTLPSFHDPTHLFFATTPIIRWKHLFIKDEYAKIRLNSLAWLQLQKRILLFAFVIMPSHLHAIFKPEGYPVGEILQQFGSFTAHEILKKLREQGQIDLLHFFERNKRDQRHEHSIWQDIQAKNIYSMEFLQQKLEYIYQNPVAKNWKLVEARAAYPYSSAGYYDYGRRPMIEITDLNDWLTSNPSPRTAKGAGWCFSRRPRRRILWRNDAVCKPRQNRNESLAFVSRYDELWVEKLA